MKLLAKMIAIVAKEFENKTDRAGKPYFLHCMRVMNQMPQDDEELMCIALAHDLIEDTDYTLMNLGTLGFSERIWKTIGLLTHDKNESYDIYIKGIALNKDATKVKLADLKDNSDITRLKGLSKSDFDRMEKYHKAFVYLSKI